MNRPTAISWWIGLPLGLLLLVILLLSLVDLFDRRLLADPLASLVEEQTGRALRIGDFDLRWGWPMSLQMEDVSLANADWGSDVPLLRAAVVSTPVNLFEVLDGPPYADLQLQDLQVLIQRSEAGEWNWMIDTARPETDEAPRLPVTVAADGGAIIYELPETLAIELQHFSLAAGRYGELVLKLRASRAGMPLAVDGTFAAAQGNWDGAAALRAGESALSSRFRMVTGAEPLRVRAHIDSGVLAPARLAELKPARESESSETSVTLPRLDEIDAEIGFDVATLRLPDLDIQNIRGHLGIKDGFAQLTDLVAYVGKARLEGGIAVDTMAQHPEIQITADLPRVPLSSLPNSLPLSTQPGDIAAQVDARLGTPGRQLPLTPMALLSQVAVPESRFLYARRTEEEQAALVSRLQVQPRGGKPSVSLALRGVDAPPFKATLSAPPLEELADQSGYPVRLTVTTEEARARIDADLGEMLQDNGFNLTFSVSGDKLPEVPALSFTPPPVPEFSLSGELQQESGRWAVREFDLSYGPSQLSGNAIYDPEEEPPGLAMDVEASLLDLTAIPREAPVQTAEGVKDSTGGWVSDGIADALREIDAEVELSADRVKLTDEHSVKEVEVAAVLEQGRLAADPVSFAAAGGSFRGSLSAHALQPVEGRLSLHLKDLEPRHLHDVLAPLQEHFGRVSGELHVAVAEAPPGQQSEHIVLQSFARLSVHGTRLRFQQPEANTDLTLTLASNGDLSGRERGISIRADGHYRGDAIQLELDGEPPVELRDRHDPYELQTQVEYADSDLRGDVTLDLSAAAPAVTASLRSNALKLDDVLGLTSAAESESDRAARHEAGSRRILPQQPFDFNFLRRADVDIDYTAGHVDAAGIPFDNVAAQVILQEGRLLAEPVSLEMAKGTATLRIDMHTRESLLEGVFDFDARGVSLSEMLSNVDIASNSFGIVGGQGKFWVRGDSLASVIGSADGGLMLAMTGGQLDSLLVEVAGLDIGEAALAASGLYNPADIDCAWASLHSTGGILDVDQFVIDTDDTVFFLNGTMDLGEETLDLALFPEAKDPSFPTTNSALAVTGALKQPEVALMTGELAARALGAAALAALSGPLSAALPFIELGLQEDPDVCEGWVEKLQSERHDE